MSSGNKSLVSSSGGRGSNKNKSQQHGKSDQHHHSKTTDTAKHDRGQSNKDQTKHAQIIDTRSGGIEDPALKEQIKQVMEVTRRSEDEVIMALHDSDWDFNRAVNDLLEGVSTEWEVKKKKPRQPSGAKQNVESADHEEGGGGGDWEERRNQRGGGGPPRLRGRANHDNRGWRGRENKENERNMEDNVREGGYGGRRGGRGGPGRSGRGGRGGGRGLGPRTFASRGDSASASGAHSFNRPIDTWTGSEEQQQSHQDASKGAGDPWNNLEPTEDWDPEEYTGSLADTKVFTPSAAMNDQVVSEESKNPQELTVQSNVQASSLAGLPQEDLSKLEVSSMQQTTSLIQPQVQTSQQSLGMSSQMQSNTLTAAQSQYLTQLTQQTSDNYKSSAQSAFSSMTMPGSQPQRQSKQRPRVPPPSKIPATAVEMPGDTVNSSIGFLDVQFGNLDCSDAALDAATDKYNSSSSNMSAIDISSSVTGSANTNSTSNTLDIDTAQQGGSYNSTSQMIASPNNAGVNYGTSVSSSAAYQPQKTSYQASNAAQTNYNAYSSTGGQSVQSYPTATGGNANSYAATTSVTQSGYSGNSSYPQSNASTFSQASLSAASASSAYNQTATSNQAYQSSSGFVPATTGTQYQVSQSTNAGANNSSGYQTSSYQGSSSFQSTPQAYQPSATTYTSPITQASNAYQSAAHSVYGSGYGNYGTQAQATSHNHTKLNSTKDSQYDSNATTSSVSMATTSAPTLGLSSAAVNSSQTKVTSSNAVPKSTSSGNTVTGASGSMTGASSAGAVSGMTPMMTHPYIMGQSLPYAAFQQPMYSFEDLAMIQQQRIPHMPTTGYYDAALGYQTTGPATSLGGGRSDALSGVPGVQSVQQGAYNSMNDGRFARSDSNASPVPSTMSQQTATQHQQPMMNPTLPPGYAYFTYGGGIMPGGFQYGAPTIYPQQIQTTGNAGSKSAGYGTQPANYGTNYGGGGSYDTLANAGPTGEYKGAGSGYTGTQSGKTGTSTGNNNSGASSAADIGATMYTKSHVALSKVNSYDKQTFHSATPPPFGSQSGGMPGYATPHLFISTMPQHIHQPLHQDGNSSSGQRSNASSQNKTQAKPGYTSTYWATGN